jgi:phage protein D
VENEWLKIPPEEVKRRIDKVSMLRETVRQLRRAAQEAYDRGESDWKPQYDERTDVEYLKRMARRHGAEV